MSEEPFEIWETADGNARFVFSYSDSELTTGVLILQPGAKLAKHNRPLGFENLTQLIGQSEMTVFDEKNTDAVEKVVQLGVGDVLKMQKGQWHIHANSHDEVSITFFKLVGDITEVMKVLRQTNQEVSLQEK